MERSPPELKLAQACELGDEPLFQALLASRPGLARALTPADRSRLAHAAQSNNTEAVRMMLAAGWPWTFAASTEGRRCTGPLFMAMRGWLKLFSVTIHPSSGWIPTTVAPRSAGRSMALSKAGIVERETIRGRSRHSFRPARKVPKKVRGTTRSKDVLRRFGARE